ncbi:class I SAM-dependent methyltransferase [Actinokineospora bangkokensis]|uniref:Methyltransferase domain-containing protein n=1 Tax=Actinokineospora bangkokensis TaxID=1193682 RepID=A0A1Q9LJI3_9PSEU|nr:class I SAM-dependent methyltransferase [Actinokineospora bangkokensis]OLR92163.1 hypothetical protein BJP25_22795 [Actinokineospora bangkokensis]
MGALGFSGDVVEHYHRYRRGYPPALVDAAVAAFGLTPDDTGVDLGCGTGQLTEPLAGRLGVVVGVDPEPDMLAAARGRGLANALWVRGSDADVPLLAAALRAPGVVTIAQALHWMDHDRLFPALRGWLRPGGGVVVVSNGTPLWLQDTDWSRALRGFLSAWLGSPLDARCGTDAATRGRYAASLRRHGFAVARQDFDHKAPLSTEQVVGGVLSALPADRLPRDRVGFAARVAAVVGGGPFTERVPVPALFARAG